MAINPCYKQGPVEIVTGQLGFSYHYDATNEKGLSVAGLNFPENPFMEVAIFNTTADGNIYQFDTINDRVFENGELSNTIVGLRSREDLIEQFK